MNYVRYDPTTGEILASGQMKEAHIDLLIDQGDHLLKTYDLVPPDGFSVDLETRRIIKSTLPVDRSGELLSVIRVDLMRTDYTQAVDAEDHIPLEERGAWRVYRKTIRAAMKASGFDEILAQLPGTDPKGVDQYAQFRRSES
jgi:hypothetical protein